MAIAAGGGSWDVVHCLASIAVQAHFPFSSILAASGSPFQQLPDNFSGHLLILILQFNSSCFCYIVICANSPQVSRLLLTGPALGCPSGTEFVSTTSFSSWSCCFSHYLNSLRFSPIQCMLLSQSSSCSLLLNSQKAHHRLACPILMGLQYLLPYSVPYTILFSDGIEVHNQSGFSSWANLNLYHGFLLQKPTSFSERGISLYFMLAISLLEQKSKFSLLSVTGHDSNWLMKGINVINNVIMTTIPDKKVHSYT